MHIVDGSMGTSSLDYQPLLRNVSPCSFPPNPPLLERSEDRTRESLEDEGSGDFQTIRNFGEDWAIIL